MPKPIVPQTRCFPNNSGRANVAKPIDAPRALPDESKVEPMIYKMAWRK
ncbi:unnamed protein product, partial [Rotaria magnacalcarata]